MRKKNSEKKKNILLRPDIYFTILEQQNQYLNVSAQHKTVQMTFNGL